MDDATLNPMADARQEGDRDLSRIVEALTERLGHAGGPPVALEGGITNRNFRARFGGADYVIRAPGKDTSLLGIDREAERVANEGAAAVGLAPPVAAFLTDPPCIVTAFVEGEGGRPERLREPRAMAAVAAALRSLHHRCAELPSDFDSFRIVEGYAALVASRGAGDARFDAAQERAAQIEAALQGADHSPVPCHNDLLAGNFILDADRLWVVDWEYAGMGNRYFDLANFAVNNELGESEQEQLLAAYFGEPPLPHRLAALRLMIYMSDFREAMWGVVQSSVSELDFDFSSYATTHFERLARTAADPRFGDWLEECRAAG